MKYVWEMRGFKLEKQQPTFFSSHSFFLLHLKSIGKTFVKWKESRINTVLKSSEMWKWEKANKEKEALSHLIISFPDF